MTWLLQVMPLFFLAGGFSNSTSLASTLKRGGRVSSWIGSRVRRLAAPVLPAVLVWTTVVAVASRLDIPYAGMGATAAMVPFWFLAVYLITILATPIFLALHERFGLWVVAGGVGGAVMVDLLRFVGGVEWVGWLNFVFVWMTIHQVGFSWADHRPSRRASLLLSGGGLLALWALTSFGPYPVSMVGFDTGELTNNLPPTLPLLVLGGLQIGLLSLATPTLERWLRKPKPWTATVLASGMAMGWYVWHMTALVVGSFAQLLWAENLLELTPLTQEWWAFRPVWIVVLVVITAVLVMLFRRFETPPGDQVERPLPAVLIGTIGVAGAFTALILIGLSDDESVRYWIPALLIGSLWATGSFGLRNSLGRLT